MEGRSLFVPFYLEYVGCINPKTGFEYSVVFRSVDMEYLTVNRKDLALYLSCSRSNVLEQTLLDGGCEISKAIESLRSFILDRYFDGIEFELIDFTGKAYSLFRGVKLRYLSAIFNCINMSFSSKEMITDEVIRLWDQIKEIDISRLKNMYENFKRTTICGSDFVRLNTNLLIKGENCSDEICRHFQERSGNIWGHITDNLTIDKKKNKTELIIH